MTARIRVGVSGWSYPHWRSTFYPAGLPHRRELEFAAHTFDALEINGSFYSLQRPSSYRRWRDAAPADFVFAVKGSRYVTHMKKLADIEVALANFLASGLLGLGDKLGPVLWQLPEALHFDRDRTAGFFELLPLDTDRAGVIARGCDDRIRRRFGEDPVTSAPAASAPLRHAIEVRHGSWATADFMALCRDYGIATVVADTAAGSCGSMR